jgi:hypothetical protein
MPTDRQISQLVLQVDANIAVAQRDLQSLARVVNQTSGQMNTALASTASAHSKLSGAFNQSRLAQMELSHVMTASVDAYAAGASPLRILTLEMGRVAQAASFMGGGSGVLGKLAGFMSGPWGIAVLLATNVLAQLIGKFATSGDSVSALVQKMREHAKQAQDSKLADEEWAKTLDGLIERNEKLTEDLKKRLKAEEDLAAQTAAGAQRDRSKAGQSLQDAQTRLANLQRELKVATAAAANAGLGTNVGGPQEAAIEAQKAKIDDLKKQVDDAKNAVDQAQQAVIQSTIAFGEEQGKALVDLTAKADEWAKKYLGALHTIENANKGALAGSTDTISSGFYALQKAISDAAGANVDFAADSNDFTKKAADLGAKLKDGTLSALSYASAMKELAKQLEAVVEAAKKANKNPVEAFKSAVIGAEGTGPNQLGSSAAGYGQFMPSTWLTYFNRLFPSQAQLSDAAKLGFRNVRSVADAVIDKATDDYVAVLKKAGQQITAANLYAVHLLGAGDATKLLRAAPGTPTSQILSAAVLNGNPFLRGTAATARTAIATRIGDSSGAVSSGAIALQKALDDQKQHELEQADAFAKESAQLDAEILSARKDQLAGFDTQADLQMQEIEAQRQATQAAIQKQRDAGQIDDDQAQELSVQADNLAAAREAAIAHRKYTDSLNQLAEMAKQNSDFQIDDLRFADEMAKTQSEHRKIQLEILDVQYKQKEADLQRLLLSIQSNKDFATSVDLQRQAMEVQAQIARLPIERAQDQTRVQQGTLDPLQQYFSNIPHDAAQVNEALQSIEAQGIDGLVNALSHAGQGWGAMRDAAISALQDIASELLRLGIQRMLFSLFGNAVMGGIGGGAGLAGDLAAPMAVTGLDTSIATSLPGGFADGGFVSGSGGPTSDSIPAMLSNGEYVMSAEAVRTFGVGYLDMMNSGNVPHKKSGGLLHFLSFLSPILFLQQHHLLKYLSPAAFLFNKLHDEHALKYLSPAAFLGDELLGGAKKSQISKQAANSNTPGGNTVNIHVVAPNTGDPIRDRQTSLQQASDIRRAVASASSKGLI